MEGLETQKNLSEQQQETIAELLDIVRPLFDSFTNSDDAYETAEKINELYGTLKEKGLNPKDYYLWSLLSPEVLTNTTGEFDTPDQDIENFIRSLK